MTTALKTFEKKKKKTYYDKLFLEDILEYTTVLRHHHLAQHLLKPFHLFTPN